MSLTRCPYCKTYLVQPLPYRPDDANHDTWFECLSCKRIWAAEEQAESRPDVQDTAGSQPH
jgi:hypothetical protein